MKKNRLAYLFLFISLFSCVREEFIEDGLPPFEEKLAVYCLLTPGDSIFVHVQRTAPFTNTPEIILDYFVSNAHIVLEDQEGISETVPLKDSVLGLYAISQSKIKVNKAQTYYLSVNTPEGLSASAQTTVPAEATKWESYKVKWPPGTNLNVDRPKVQIIGKWVNNEEIPGNQLVHTEITERYEYIDSDKIEFVNRSFLSTRIGRIEYGKHLSYSFEISLQTAPDSPRAIIKTHKVESLLITMNNDFEKYQNVVEIIINNDDEIGIGDYIDLFTGIIPEYSNIEGGTGIFGAYLTDKATLNFKF